MLLTNLSPDQPSREVRGAEEGKETGLHRTPKPICEDRHRGFGFRENPSDFLSSSITS